MKGVLVYDKSLRSFSNYHRAITVDDQSEKFLTSKLA